MLYTENCFYSTTHKLRICLRDRFTCQSENIIYVLQCPVCSVQYVGQTRTTLRQRLLKHRNKFRDKAQTPRRKLYQHFDEHIGKFNPIVIPVATTNPRNIHATEKFWINKVGTLTPHGLNDIWL